MKYITTTLALLLPFLAGCTTYSPSIPDGYEGPKALITDSATVYDTKKVDYFFVEKVSNLPIFNTKVASRQTNYGRGLSMQAVTLDHEIPAGAELTVSITGKTEHAAPILAMTSAEYEVKGDVRFTPTEGTTYVVKGILSDALSEIWLEDQNSGQVVGEKIRPAGSAKLGFFEK